MARIRFYSVFYTLPPFISYRGLEFLMSILLFYESIDIDVNSILNSSDEAASYNGTLDFNTSFGTNFRAEFDLMDLFNVTGESGDTLYSN